MTPRAPPRFVQLPTPSIVPTSSRLPTRCVCRRRGARCPRSTNRGRQATPPAFHAGSPVSSAADSRGRCSGSGCGHIDAHSKGRRSEEHTSELQSLMRISYAVFCLKKKKKTKKSQRQERNHNTKRITETRIQVMKSIV